MFVTIVEARGILAADSNGFSDPYVTMTVLDSRGNTIAAGGTFKTKTLKKTLSPKWNEEFLVGDKSDLRLATTLRLVLSDSDGMFAMNDDALGVVDIPVALFQGATQTVCCWTLNEPQRLVLLIFVLISCVCSLFVYVAR